MPDQMEQVDILLVEDNPTDAELCMRALKKYNLANRLVWVKDGVEALDFLFSRGEFAHRQAERLPQVVLLDLRMPRVDGLEVLRQVKADELLKVVPIVVLTSSKEDRDVKEAYKLGANGFVPKPVEFTEFADAVAQFGMYWVLVNKPPPAVA